MFFNSGNGTGTKHKVNALSYQKILLLFFSSTTANAHLYISAFFFFHLVQSTDEGKGLIFRFLSDSTGVHQNNISFVKTGYFMSLLLQNAFHNLRVVNIHLAPV